MHTWQAKEKLHLRAENLHNTLLGFGSKLRCWKVDDPWNENHNVTSQVENRARQQHPNQTALLLHEENKSPIMCFVILHTGCLFMQFGMLVTNLHSYFSRIEELAAFLKYGQHVWRTVSSIWDCAVSKSRQKFTFMQLKTTVPLVNYLCYINHMRNVATYSKHFLAKY